MSRALVIASVLVSAAFAASLTALALAQPADTCPAPGSGTTTLPYPTDGSPYDPTGDDDKGGATKKDHKKKHKDHDETKGGDTCPGGASGGGAGGVTSVPNNTPADFAPIPSPHVIVEGNAPRTRLTPTGQNTPHNASAPAGKHKRRAPAPP